LLSFFAALGVFDFFPVFKANAEDGTKVYWTITSHACEHIKESDLLGDPGEDGDESDMEMGHIQVGNDGLCHLDGGLLGSYPNTTKAHFYKLKFPYNYEKCCN
jgi:hypothetical protein